MTDILEESCYQSFYVSSTGNDALPVSDLEAEVTTGQGLLPVAAAFFLTTRDPNAPPPPRVPTLLSQLAILALFTPPAEVSC